MCTEGEIKERLDLIEKNQAAIIEGLNNLVDVANNMTTFITSLPQQMPPGLARMMGLGGGSEG